MINNLLLSFYLLNPKCKNVTNNNDDFKYQLEIATCPPEQITTGNSDKFYDELQQYLDYMQWVLAVLAVGSLIIIGTRIIIARLSNDPNQSAKSIEAIGFVFLGLIISGAAVSIIDVVY